MSYTKTTWSNGDVISAAKLNNAEGGIEANDLAISDLKSDLGDLSDLETTDKSSIVAAINEARQSGGSGALTQDTKQALLQCFAHTAWTDAHGQDYYDDLEDALYPFDLLSTISAVYTQSGTVYDTDSLDSLKADLVVTGTYSDGTYNTIRNYTLSGTLTVGTSTITVAYGGNTATFTVTVTQAAATLTSISAVYTQSGAVYDTDTLDSLKTDLVVTAHYSDSTTETVQATDYTLSGTLTVGTSTVTVSYSGKTTTFTITVSQATTYINHWDLTSSLTDSVGGVVATLGGSATQDSSGVHLSGAGQHLKIEGLFTRGHSFEVDVTDFSRQGTGHGRLFAIHSASGQYDSGVLWRSTNKWATYNMPSSWSDSSNTDSTYLNGKTLKIDYADDSSVKIYADDELMMSCSLPSSRPTTGEYINFEIGSQNGSSAYNLTITGIRIKEL